MHAHLDRFAPLPLVSLASLVALLAAAATGCALAPAPAEPAEEGKTSSEITVVRPSPIVLDLSPVQDCSLTAANESSGYPASPGELFTGTSAPSTGTCDYYVTEVTGVLDKSILLAVAATPDLITTDATSCTESYETFWTYGYVPTRFVFNGISVTEVPGAWESIESKTIYGVWLGAQLPGNANCALNAFVEPYPATTAATGILTASPYETLRVATQAVYYENGVATRAPMGTYVVPQE